MLANYYDFGQVIKNIRAVVHGRVEIDFYGWVDFRREHYLITNAYYIKRKHLVENNKKMQKYLKSVETGQLATG